MLTKRERIGLSSAAILTALVGIVNLLSAVSLNLPDRIESLENFVPFEVRANAHIFAAIIGFFLLTLATNLLRRKQYYLLLLMVQQDFSF